MAYANSYGGEKRKMMDIVKELFKVDKAIIGMVHLLPLPGSPRYDDKGMEPILEHALSEGRRLLEGGADAMLVENYNDNPFKPTTTDPETIIPMAIIARELKKEVGLPMGIQVLRSSPKSSMAMAKFTGGSFIRFGPMTGAFVTDQGILQARAHDVMRYRKIINAEDIKIFGSAVSKHGAPLVKMPVEFQAKEVAYRAMADVILVCGERTGEEPEMDNLIRVKRAVPDKPIFLGSGLTKKNVVKFFKHADGAIVGTSIKVDGNVHKPVDVKRLKALIKIVQKIRKTQ